MEEIIDTELMKGQFYKVKFNTGKIAYIASMDMLKDSYYFRKYISLCDDTECPKTIQEKQEFDAKKRLEEERRQAEERQLEEKRLIEERMRQEEQEEKEKLEEEKRLLEEYKKRDQEVENMLKEVGILKGRYLWFKYPQNDLPSLTRIKLNDYAIIYPGIRLYVEINSELIEIDFLSLTPPDNIKRIKKAFYIIDPSKRVAKWGHKILASIKEGKVFIGMTKEQVTLSWGPPEDVNRSIGSWGVHEQWVYGDTYLYFENDKLTSWQD